MRRSTKTLCSRSKISTLCGGHRLLSGILLILIALALLLLGGCGGSTPDLSGNWSGQARVPDHGTTDNLGLRLALQQSGDKVAGVAYLKWPRKGKDITSRLVVSSGEVSDSGKVRLVATPVAGGGGDRLNLKGTVSNGKMWGKAFLSGTSATGSFRARQQ